MKSIVLLLLLSVFSLQAFSEPSSTIQKLMFRPVSWFDMGIYKLQNKLKEKYPSLRSRVYFDIRDNKIYIELNYPDSLKTGKLDSFKKWCIDTIDSVRIELGVYEGKPFPDTATYSWASKLFLSESYYDSYQLLQEEGVSKKMIDDEIVIYSIYVDIKNPSIAIRCEAPLIGKSVDFITKS